MGGSRRSAQAKLDDVRALREEPLSPQKIQNLRAAVRDASNFVVAAAGEIVGDQKIAELEKELVDAYERFLVDPLKQDKQCRAKIALLVALSKLDYSDENFYLRAVRYVQLEPVWGGSVDTAIPIRVDSAFALVRLRHRGVLTLLIDMLAEQDKQARIGAVHALTNAGSEAAWLLLRLKARLGDVEAEVTAECLSSVIELNPEEGIPFVGEFVTHKDQSVAESALLALGNSRKPTAFEILKSFDKRCPDRLKKLTHFAMALLRIPSANDYLINLVSKEPLDTAESALDALSVQRHDPRVCERVTAILATRKDRGLDAVYQKQFVERA